MSSDLSDYPRGPSAAQLAAHNRDMDRLSKAAAARKAAAPKADGKSGQK